MHGIQTLRSGLTKWAVANCPGPRWSCRSISSWATMSTLAAASRLVFVALAAVSVAGPAHSDTLQDFSTPEVEVMAGVVQSVLKHYPADAVWISPKSITQSRASNRCDGSGRSPLVRRLYEAVGQATFQAFCRAQDTPARLPRAQRRSAGARTLQFSLRPRSEVQTLRIAFSRAGFNEDETLALIYCEYRNRGMFYLLSKSDSDWQVTEALQVWIA